MQCEFKRTTQPIESPIFDENTSRAEQTLIDLKIKLTQLFSSQNLSDHTAQQYIRHSKKSHKPPRLVNIIKNQGRLGIYGIGKTLQAQDTGKSFIRVAPLKILSVDQNSLTYDWSYVPFSLDSHSPSSIFKLIKLEDSKMQMESNSEVMDFDLTFNDGNWIEIDHLKNLLNKDFFKKFKSVNASFLTSNQEKKCASKPQELGTQENEKWVEKIKTKISAQPKDSLTPLYSKSNREEIDTLTLLNLQKLGLSLEENTPEKIKKAYYRLSRKLHPDKNPQLGNKEFQEINLAYKFLIAPAEEFNVTNDSPIEKTLFDAKKYADYLSSITHSMDDENNVKKWSAFLSDLRKISLIDCGEDLYKFHFFTLINEIQDRVHYHQFKLALAEIQNDLKRIIKKGNYEEVIADFPKLLQGIYFLQRDYDLSNTKNTWWIANQNFFMKANLYFIELFLAAHKILAEGLIVQGKFSQAGQVRFIIKRDYPLLQKGIHNAQMHAENEYRLKQSLLSQKSSSGDSEKSSLTEEQILSTQKERPPHAKTKKIPNPIPRDPLETNIQDLFCFFE